MSAILNAAEGIENSSNPDATLIADGGIKYIGDIAKALAAGADYVMSGYLFAGCTETPNPTNYRGMASKDVQEQYRGSVSNSTPEGVSLDVEPRGSVREVYEQIAGGLRSALAYSGCADLQEFKENAILNIVSSHTHLENGVRK
jgi:IMP dehydrogenase